MSEPDKCENCGYGRFRKEELFNLDKDVAYSCERCGHRHLVKSDGVGSPVLKPMGEKHMRNQEYGMASAGFRGKAGRSMEKAQNSIKSAMGSQTGNMQIQMNRCTCDNPSTNTVEMGKRNISFCSECDNFVSMREVDRDPSDPERSTEVIGQCSGCDQDIQSHDNYVEEGGRRFCSMGCVNAQFAPETIPPSGEGDE